MMLTREQAAATWCPMVRTARAELHPAGSDRKSDNDRTVIVAGCNTDALGGNRVPASCRCIADQCAMWRWGEPAAEKREAASWWPAEDYPETEPPRLDKVPADAEWIPLSGPKDDPEGGYWVEPQSKVDAANTAADAGRRGYCGLAGAPVIVGGGL